MNDVVITCGVCGQRGPWLLTLCWWDESARYEVPGGQTQWMEGEARVACACSMECGRRFALAAVGIRISITRPEADDRKRRNLVAQIRIDVAKRAGQRAA